MNKVRRAGGSRDPLDLCPEGSVQGSTACSWGGGRGKRGHLLILNINLVNTRPFQLGSLQPMISSWRVNFTFKLGANSYFNW